MKCPKCQNQNLNVQGCWEVNSGTYQLVDGKIVENDMEGDFTGILPNADVSCNNCDWKGKPKDTIDCPYYIGTLEQYFK